MRKLTILTTVLSIIAGFAVADSGDFDRYDIPYKGEKELNVYIDFAFGSMDIRPSSNNEYILRAGMNYSKLAFKPSLKYKISGNQGNLKLSTENHGEDFSLKDFKRLKKSDQENNWRLEFIQQIPGNYDIEFGAGDGTFDFSGMAIRNMDFELAMGDVELYFNEANAERLKEMNIETGLGSFEARGLGNANIDNFRLECGLGSSYLVFDGEFEGTLRSEISVGLGSVEIEIPRNVAVEIHSESSFLSSVSFDDFEAVGSGHYRSDNWRSNSNAKMIIDISVGMGSADIKWID